MDFFGDLLLNRQKRDMGRSDPGKFQEIPPWYPLRFTHHTISKSNINAEIYKSSSSDPAVNRAAYPTFGRCENWRWF